MLLNVFAIPKIVPEKFGAISSPFPRYPAVTAPLSVSATVKIATAQTLSYPKNINKMNISPGGATANLLWNGMDELNIIKLILTFSQTYAVNPFRATVVVILPVDLWSVKLSIWLHIFAKISLFIHYLKWSAK